MPHPNKDEDDDEGMATFEDEKEKAMRESGSTGPVVAAESGKGDDYLAIDAFEREHEEAAIALENPPHSAGNTGPGAVNVVVAQLNNASNSRGATATIPPTHATQAEAKFRSKQFIQNPQQLINTVGTGGVIAGKEGRSRYEGYLDRELIVGGSCSSSAKRQSRYEGYLEESDEIPLQIHPTIPEADNLPGAYPYQPTDGGTNEQPETQPEEATEPTNRPVHVSYDPNVADDTTTPPSPQAEQQDNAAAAVLGEDSGDGLAVAHMVESSFFMVRADEVDPEDLTRRERTKSATRAANTKQFLWGMGMIAVVLLVVSLTLVIVFTTKQEKKKEESEIINGPSNVTESENTTSNASSGLPPSPEEQKEKLQGLLPAFTVEAIEQDDDSPQSLAFRWLLSDTDHFHLYPDWRLLQRYILATVFFSTGGPTTWRKSDGWLDYNLHECQWWSQPSLTPPGLSQPNFTTPDGRPYFPYQHVCNVPPDIVPNITLTDDIPYSDLWLWANHLEGDLPREVFALPSLRSMSLVNNPGLTGVITSDIGQLPDLLGWTISKTGLSFTIPTEIGLVRNFVSIHALWSGVHGTLPTELGSLNMMQWLRLDETRITGTVPSQLGSLAYLERLLLGKNSMTGTVPTQLGRLSRLRWLDLSRTELTGTLPSELGLLSSLEILRLERSQFSGSVPAEILSLPNLVAQNLTGNEQLTGEVPAVTCADVLDLGFTCAKFQ